MSDVQGILGEERDRLVIRTSLAFTWEDMVLPVLTVASLLLSRWMVMPLAAAFFFLGVIAGLVAILVSWQTVLWRMRHGKHIEVAELTPTGINFFGGPMLSWAGFTAFKRVTSEGTKGFIGFVMTPEQLSKMPNNGNAARVREKWRSRFGVDYLLLAERSGLPMEKLAEYVSRFVPEDPAVSMEHT